MFYTGGSNMKYLFVIPARGGSKGIPGKNIKLLGNKPLIHYSIEYARLFADDQDICVTTDSDEIATCALEIGYKCSFLRPNHLATDKAGSYEVVQHALSLFDNLGKPYDAVVLLQPTSPFREKQHLKEMLSLLSPKNDMIVSVCEAKGNPYYNLFEENTEGYLKVSKGEGCFTRRQDVPPVYEYNGSIYVVSAESLRTKSAFRDFKAIKKYEMSEAYSIDLDTPTDWQRAEFFLKTKKEHEQY